MPVLPVQPHPQPGECTSCPERGKAVATAEPQEGCVCLSSSSAAVKGLSGRVCSAAEKAGEQWWEETGRAGLWAASSVEDWKLGGPFPDSPVLPSDLSGGPVLDTGGLSWFGAPALPHLVVAVSRGS